MKLKKLALNAIAMEHSEMKHIKAGGVDDFVECQLHLNNRKCEQPGKECTTREGESGSCVFGKATSESGNEYIGSCYCLV